MIQWYLDIRDSAQAAHDIARQVSELAPDFPLEETYYSNPLDVGESLRGERHNIAWSICFGDGGAEKNGEICVFFSLYFDTHVNNQGCAILLKTERDPSKNSRVSTLCFPDTDDEKINKFLSDIASLCTPGQPIDLKEWETEIEIDQELVPRVVEMTIKYFIENATVHKPRRGKQRRRSR